LGKLSEYSIERNIETNEYIWKIDLNSKGFSDKFSSQDFYNEIIKILEIVPENRLTVALDEIEWISFKTSPKNIGIKIFAILADNESDTSK